jgi:hypothetical protein
MERSFKLRVLNFFRAPPPPLYLPLPSPSPPHHHHLTPSPSPPLTPPPSSPLLHPSNQTLFPDPHHLHNGYHSYAIEDTVMVPMGIPAGEYVLGWRWGEYCSLLLVCAGLALG